MDEAVRGRKGDGKEPLIMCRLAFSGKIGNFPLDMLVVYFQQ
jgi:hypothetical protein